MVFSMSKHQCAIQRLRPASSLGTAQHRRSAHCRSSRRQSRTGGGSHDGTYDADLPARDASRRQALLAAVLLGAPAFNPQQPARASPAAQGLAQQQQQQQAQLVQRLTGRRPIVVTLADLQADYDRYAGSYDGLDGGAASEALGFPQLRQQLLQQARGAVLEVGVGTGLNLPLYDWSNIASLTGVDLSEGMLQQAAARAAAMPGAAGASAQLAGAAAAAVAPAGDAGARIGSSSGLPGAAPVIKLLQADVEALPFPDGSFDTVLDTFSLCVFPDPAAAVAEMTRVLRPGGQLLLLEHTRSDNLLLGAYQATTRSAVASISKGCDWGQDVPALLSGLPQLSVVQLQRHLAGTLVSIAASRQASPA